LLVVLTLVLVVTGTALTLALSARGLYRADRARSDLNQNLRSAKHLVLADLRQAGERLGSDFPALTITDGASGAPDEVAVRRNLGPSVFRLCRDLSAGQADVYIGEPLHTPPPPGCTEVPDGDGDLWPDNLQEWRDYRAAHGPQVRAYIWDPVNRRGEFFDFVGEDKDELTIQAASHAWSNSYSQVNNCRIYLLEERRYRLSGDTLQLVLNDDASDPVNLLDRVSGFQATAVFQDGTEQTTLGASDLWTDLRAIRIRLDGRVILDSGEPIERGWVTEVMPRNVLSN
jgi:type IV pilus assembly protein PilW